MWQYNQTPSNTLIHYGKKGMKWGRRKSIGPNGAKVTTTRLPMYTKIKTKNIDGSVSRQEISKGPFGTVNKTTTLTKKQVMIGRAAVAVTMASYGAVLVSTLR